jgi:hypothetical protein
MAIFICKCPTTKVLEPVSEHLNSFAKKEKRLAEVEHEIIV